ncbi:type III secretion system outer membrane ring subunit SctC [Chromobacterium subtsugae]|uniref:Type 3 secretion system secretin n=1 Tax=Chromobacterium subtsugae TaxID=251747 RepID=A0ABS7FF01_9NEIS|nr:MULTISPECIES: type III secretion system outer membrane ring subunit SctC [Chromobacterium]KUM02138.1 type III secretion system outer membrane pore InvG [Chromobacterium subtsugae]KZE88087.1 type III secretion system outer membrane pore InvG [Chromobacterium sp. F49]MBW7565744.1 type III secretion system outer membrane ring subunit SctC [Chromobacterium subtsugae]MBW8288551.1 type III secretion system outer membrane ring subunit SctC [Chromobacterium subtsugae]WSE89839.1 type III secretion s
MNKSLLLAACLGCALSLPPASALAAPPAERAGEDAGYVARKDSLRAFFDALSSRLKKPVIVSKLAARKQVSGDFDLSSPQALLEKMSQQLGLIWYHDGQAIYVYDASETRSAVLSLRNVTLSAFNDFLRKSGLYDKRYPLRGDGRSGTFYVSGPPVFVDLVSSAAAMMDKQSDGLDLGRQKIGVVKLNNTFVSDRNYELRDQKISIPGMATVIEKLLEGEQKPVRDVAAAPPARRGDIPPMPDFPGAADLKPPPYAAGLSLPEALKQEAAAGDIRVIAYPDTNSLLVKGTAEQVRFIESLAQALDVAKRHVELSLWIIDMQKDDLDQLGVNWNGSVSVGNKLGVAFNQSGSLSTLDGTRFIASVMALSRDNKANVVSRPVVLTQENVPAIFDNNRTFYAKLVGERSVDLQHVTYGTLVSVLPRFAADGQIEMSLNIEDGRETRAPDYSQDNKDAGLPEVGRTRISTVARVPQGKSLLIGGYTRDASDKEQAKVPLLGDLPLLGGLFRYQRSNQSNTVRVFLIQPREIDEPLMPDASDLSGGLPGGAGVDADPLQQWVRGYLDREQRNGG